MAKRANLTGETLWKKTSVPCAHKFTRGVLFAAWVCVARKMALVVATSSAGKDASLAMRTNS